MWLLTLLAAAAFAAPLEGSVKSACSKELSKHCPKAEGDAASACLTRNISRVSKDCRSAMRAAKRGQSAAPAPAKDSCRSEAAKVCPGLFAGPAHEKCLREHAAELPAVCRAKAPVQP